MDNYIKYLRLEIMKHTQYATFWRRFTNCKATEYFFMENKVTKHAIWVPG